MHCFLKAGNRSLTGKELVVKLSGVWSESLYLPFIALWKWTALKLGIGLERNNNKKIKKIKKEKHSCFSAAFFYFFSFFFSCPQLCLQLHLTRRKRERTRFLRGEKPVDGETLSKTRTLLKVAMIAPLHVHGMSFCAVFAVFVCGKSTF